MKDKTCLQAHRRRPGGTRTLAALIPPVAAGGLEGRANPRYRNPNPQSLIPDPYPASPPPRPAASANSAVRWVFSQVNSGSLRPKCPPEAV